MLAAWQVQAHIRLTQAGITVNSIDSERTPDYNCIAHAADDNTQRWWPFALPGWFWPVAIAGDSVADFVAAFRTKNYDVCADGTLEQGFEKVAFYAENGHVRHAARQLANGQWKSKLGHEVDVTHSLDQLETARAPALPYGSVVAYMRRPVVVAANPNPAAGIAPAIIGTPQAP